MPTLAPYQVDIVGRLSSLPTSAPFFFPQMGTGTGKSNVILYTCRILAEKLQKPALILVPNSCITEMRDEAIKFMGEQWVKDNVEIYYKTTIKDRALQIRRSRKSLHILGHEALSFEKIAHALYKREWASVAIDEASRFRRSSARTKVLTYLAKHTSYRFIFTGRLVTKSADDYWYPVQFMSHKVFKNYQGRDGHSLFRNTFCELGGITGTKPIGTLPEKANELKAMLAPYTLTINLSDVRDDLPERQIFTRRVSLKGDQLQAYEQMLTEMIVEIEGVDDKTYRSVASTYANRAQRLLEIAAGFARLEDGSFRPFKQSAKTEEVISLLEDDASPTIIWGWWRPEIAVISERLEAAGIPHITSYTRDWKERYKSGEVPHAVLQMGTGGYGLNLDMADRMLYHSLYWDLDIVQQSQERNWRFTTTRPRVVQHIIADGTYDERVLENLMNGVRNSLMDSRSDALELLERCHANG